MIICGACGHENPDDEFCQSCGRYLDFTRTQTALTNRPRAAQPIRVHPSPGPQVLREPIIHVGGTVGRGEARRVARHRCEHRNASTVVDRVSITIEGLSAAWWKIEPTSVRCTPERKAEVRLEFRPTTGPDVPAGSTPGSRCEHRRIRPTSGWRRLRCRWLWPRSRSPLVGSSAHGRRGKGGGTGRHMLNIANDGNAPWPATIRAVDPDARIRPRAAPSAWRFRPVGGGRRLTSLPRAASSSWADRPSVLRRRGTTIDGGSTVAHEALFDQASLFRSCRSLSLLGVAAALIVAVSRCWRAGSAAGGRSVTELQYRTVGRCARAAVLASDCTVDGDASAGLTGRLADTAGDADAGEHPNPVGRRRACPGVGGTSSGSARRSA